MSLPWMCMYGGNSKVTFSCFLVKIVEHSHHISQTCLLFLFPRTKKLINYFYSLKISIQGFTSQTESILTTSDSSAEPRASIIGDHVSPCYSQCLLSANFSIYFQSALFCLCLFWRRQQLCYLIYISLSGGQLFSLTHNIK